MSGLAILLLLTPHIGYARAGIATGASVATAGISNVLLARAVDRIGARRVLAPASVGYLAGVCVLASLADASYPAQLAVCAVLGFASAPISSVSRGMWASLLGEEQAQVLYGLEATAQELVFIAGPASVALIAGTTSAQVALVVSGVLGFVGTLGYVTAQVFGISRSVPDHEREGGVLRGRVAAYAVVGVCLTIGFSMTEIATVAFVGGRHATTASGVVLAVWSGGSLAGGLTFGAGAAQVTDRALAGVVAIAGVGLALAVAAPGTIGLAVILFASGAAIAPVLARLYTRMGAVAPAGAVTESFGWLAVGFQVGSAIGAALGGICVDAIGPRSTFAVAGGAALLGLVAIGSGRARRAQRTVAS
jgi:MFS family permease